METKRCPLWVAIMAIAFAGSTASSQWLVGDTHCHSEHSDGDGTLYDLSIVARNPWSSEQAIQDFFVLTDHNWDLDPREWDDIWSECEIYATDSLTIVPGCEITDGGGGHTGSFGFPSCFPGIEAWTNKDPRINTPNAEIIRKIHAHKGLAFASHPYSPAWGGYLFEEGGDCRDTLDGIEIYNGSLLFDKYDESAVDAWRDFISLPDYKGKCLVGIGGSDCHASAARFGNSGGALAAPHCQLLGRSDVNGRVALGIAELVHDGRVVVADYRNQRMNFELTIPGLGAHQVGDLVRAQKNSKVDIELRVSGRFVGQRGSWDEWSGEGLVEFTRGGIGEEPQQVYARAHDQYWWNPTQARGAGDVGVVGYDASSRMLTYVLRDVVLNNDMWFSCQYRPQSRNCNEVGFAFSNPIWIDVTPPSCKIVPPAKGTYPDLIVGRTYTIRWSAKDLVGMDSAAIYLSTDGGNTYPPEGRIHLKPLMCYYRYRYWVGSYPWKIPNISSDHCRLKLVAYDLAGHSAVDITTQDFSIARSRKAVLKGTLRGDNRAFLGWRFEGRPTDQFVSSHLYSTGPQRFYDAHKETSYVDHATFAPGERRDYHVWTLFLDKTMLIPKLDSVRSRTVSIYRVKDDGCPFASVFDGNSMLLDNSMLAGSDFYPTEDILDYYVLSQPLAAVDGQYNLRIDEPVDEITSLDQVQLLTVDHAEDVTVGTTPAPNSSIIAWRDEIRPDTCVASSGQDVTSELQEQDDGVINLTYGGWVDLVFGSVDLDYGWQDKALLITFASKPDKRYRIDVYVPGEREGWELAGHAYPRFYSSTQVVPLAEYCAAGNARVRLVSVGNAAIDRVAMVRPEEGLVATEECPLATASFWEKMANGTFVQRDARLELTMRDADYVTLKRDEFVECANACLIPEVPGLMRDIILVTAGHVVLRGAGPLSGSGHVEPIVSYMRVKPTIARAAVQIEFGLPTSREVSVLVFDACGRAVARLVDGRLSAGVHQVVWDRRSLTRSALPLGVYFVTYRDAEVTFSSKLILLD